MRLLSTRTETTKLLSRSTKANEVAKDMNKSLCHFQAQEQGHIRLPSTRRRAYEVAKLKNKDK